MWLNVIDDVAIVKKLSFIPRTYTNESREMSISVCVRMNECLVAFFTLSLPFLVVMLSHIIRVDNELRKELETLSYFSDDLWNNFERKVQMIVLEKTTN